MVCLPAGSTALETRCLGKQTLYQLSYSRVGGEDSRWLARLANAQAPHDGAQREEPPSNTTKITGMVRNMV
jgi:hypothetical protein